MVKKMPITIIEDLIAGTDYEETDRIGMFERPYRVCGLPSNSGITAAALYASDGAKVIPRAGQMHPTMPDFRVRSVRVVPVPRSRTDVMLFLRYVKTRRRLLDIRLDAVSSIQQMDFDRNGEILMVGYKRPKNYGDAALPANTVIPYPPVAKGGDPDIQYDYAEVPIRVCEVSLEIDYFEKGSPFEQMAKYINTVNSKTWQKREARRWFQDGFRARIDSAISTNNSVDGDGVVTGDDAVFDFIVTRRFLLLPPPPLGSWDPMLIFIDRTIGLKPNDISPKLGGWLSEGKTSGNGWRVQQVYEATDFNEMKLASAVNPPPT